MPPVAPGAVALSDSCASAGQSLRNLRVDDLAAQGDEHVGERRLVLLPVPRSTQAPPLDVLLGLAVERIPGDSEALAEEAEGHGAQHCLLSTTARLADAERLLGILEPISIAQRSA